MMDPVSWTRMDWPRSRLERGGGKGCRKMHGTLANLRHERFAQALARGKTATEAYVLAGYKANDGNASRMKGNERISARVQEIVGHAAERAEGDVERSLQGLGAMPVSAPCK